MTELYAIIIFLFVLFSLRELRLGWISFDGCGLGRYEPLASRPAGDAMITTIWTGASSWTSQLCHYSFGWAKYFRTRLSEDMFRGLSPWMRFYQWLTPYKYSWVYYICGRLRSSAATLNMVGKMSIPELQPRLSRVYDYWHSAGAATLSDDTAIADFVVYGVTINESITKLFMAGVFPGLVLAGLFMAYIVVWHFRNWGPATRTIHILFYDD